MRSQASEPNPKTLDRDVAQVCENGHVVNSFSVWAVSQNHEFCPTCGSKTQTQCAGCSTPIPGGLRHLGLSDPDTGEQSTIYKEPVRSIPFYCTKCGQAFPWAGKTDSGKDKQTSASQLASLTVLGSGNVIQLQSPNSGQVASISRIEESFKKLGELVNQCPASDLDKEEAMAALERLRQLEQKPKSPEILAKANEKLALLRNTIGTAVELGKLAAPYITLLGSHFAK